MFFSTVSFLHVQISKTNPTPVPMPSSWEHFPVLQPFPSHFLLSGQRCCGSPMWKRDLESGQTRGTVPLCLAPVSHCALRRMDGGFCWNGDVPSATEVLRAELHPSALLWVPPPGQGGHLCPGCPMKNISGVWGSAILPPEPEKTSLPLLGLQITPISRPS